MLGVPGHAYTWRLRKILQLLVHRAMLGCQEEMLQHTWNEPRPFWLEREVGERGRKATHSAYFPTHLTL